MRIIAGLYKGRKIKAPKGFFTRPTQDRIKESLFNILFNEIYGKKVLDLFAGSGNLGIESLSRGAKSSIFVDEDKTAVEIIKNNLEHLKIDKNAQVLKLDVISAIKNFHKNNEKFDIIFLDPPYDKNYEEKVINSILEYDILNDKGLLIIEHSGFSNLDEAYGFLKLIRNRKYGKTTQISIFEKGSLL